MYKWVFNPVDLVHNFLAQLINPGDITIDATAGNGNDTLRLARLVGDEGIVYAFDIQEQAILETKAKLATENLLHRVELCNTGHENLEDLVKKPVKAVMFNLGYLPKGDHAIITLPETTLRALEQSCKLLQPNGMISIMIYSGHEGGKAEEEAVLTWAAGINQKEFNILKCQFVNRPQHAPYVLLIEKNG